MAIALWNVERLSDELKQNSISQIDEFKYLLIFSLMTLVTFYEALYVGEPYTLSYTIDWLGAILIEASGLYYIYRLNKVGDNRDLIRRYLTLGLPVGVRLFVFLLPIAVIFFALESLLSENLAQAFEIGFFWFYFVLFYIYLGKYIKRTAKTS